MKKLNSRKLSRIERQIATAIETIHEYISLPNRFIFSGLDTSMMLVDKTSPSKYYPSLTIPVSIGSCGEVFLHSDRLERARKLIKATSVQIVFFSVDSFYVNFYFD